MTIITPHSLLTTPSPQISSYIYVFEKKKKAKGEVSHYAALASMELTTWTRLALNSQEIHLPLSPKSQEGRTSRPGNPRDLPLCLPSTEIAKLCQHTQSFPCGLDLMSLCVCGVYFY